VFLATLKLLDSDTTSSQSTTPSGQPDHPASETSWVSGLIGEFSEAFQDPLPDGLHPMRKEVHSIPTKPGHPPPFRQMHRLSPLEYRELEKQVTAFLKAGILEVSTSPYGAPILFVPKPNGRGLRLCVDYRALNAIIAIFQYRRRRAGRRRRQWRSRGGTKRRPDYTEEPEAAGQGVPAHTAPGPAAGESRRQSAWGVHGSQ
jgi:hypothetical protein